MKKTILVVAYGGGHINMVIPIIRELKKNPKWEIKVLGLTTAGQALEREGIPYWGFHQFVENSDKEALNFGKQLAEGIPGGKVSYDETVAYLGLSYKDLVDRLGEKEAAHQFKNEGRQAFCPTTILERILKKVNPDLLIATNSPRAEKAAILSAHKLGIPSICLVDLFALWEVEWIGKPFYADQVCVLSNYVKDIIVSGGRNPSDVVVTGNPAFDRLAQTDLHQKGLELRKQRGWKNSKVLLWCSQPEPKAHPLTGNPGDPELPRKIDRTLIGLLPRHPEWHLVIRPHPNENVQFKTLPDRVELSSPADDLEILLHAVDGIVTMTSTVGLQGALIEKPFITIQMSVYTPDAPYADMGIALGVNNLDDLEMALVDILEKGWQPEVKLSREGRATEKVLEVIKSLT